MIEAISHASWPIVFDDQFHTAWHGGLVAGVDAAESLYANVFPSVLVPFKRARRPGKHSTRSTYTLWTRCPGCWPAGAALRRQISQRFAPRVCVCVTARIVFNRGVGIRKILLKSILELHFVVSIFVGTRSHVDESVRTMSTTVARLQDQVLQEYAQVIKNLDQVRNARLCHASRPLSQTVP